MSTLLGSYCPKCATSYTITGMDKCGICGNEKMQDVVAKRRPAS